MKFQFVKMPSGHSLSYLTVYVQSPKSQTPAQSIQFVVGLKYNMMVEAWSMLAILNRIVNDVSTERHILIVQSG